MSEALSGSLVEIEEDQLELSNVNHYKYDVEPIGMVIQSETESVSSEMEASIDSEMESKTIYVMICVNNIYTLEDSEL